MIDVYCHTSPSGKKYVGVARGGWKARWRSHTFDARHGSQIAFHRAIRKYGPAAFTHEVLERMSTDAGARRAEQLWIAELGSQAHGYNETAGGDGLPSPSAATRAKISAAHKGKKVSAETRELLRLSNTSGTRGPHSARHCARISAALTGRRLSPEAKEKIRSANLGKKQSEETRAKRAQSMREAHARRRGAA